MINFSNRRQFLLGAVLSTAGVAATLSFKHHNSRFAEPYTEQQTLLRGIIDTIIPEDQSPGGLALDLDNEIEGQMIKQPSFDTLIARLTGFVSKASLSTHRQPFHLLNVEDRETVLLKMLERSAPRRARFDLQQLRQRLMALYYISPAGQHSINYVAPNRYPAYAQVI